MFATEHSVNHHARDPVGEPAFDAGAVVGQAGGVEARDLGVAAGINLASCGNEGGEAVAILDQVLPPADAVYVLEQDFDLAANQ